MSRLSYFIILLIIFNGCKQKKIKTDYDVIIVGGGVAGLAAGYYCNPGNILLLEKDSILGGRVLTKSFENKYYYDLGAVFAYDTSGRNLFQPNNAIIEQLEPIGIFVNDTLYSGETPLESMQKVPYLQKSKLQDYYYKRILSNKEINLLEKPYYDMFNIYLKSVFPASLKNYNEDISYFVWSRYNSSHFVKGNKILVDHFIEKKSFKYECNTLVKKIIENGNSVSVIYIRNGIQDTVTAKKVIVATTSNVATKIIADINNESRKFLDGVKYAAYYSIAIGIDKKINENDISYLMPLNTGFSSILKQDTYDSLATIFQLYVADEDIPKFKDTADMRIKSYEILDKIWQIKRYKTLFYDMVYWKNAGVIINEHYKEEWSPDALMPSENVILAGDYANIHFKVPYGMIPAIISGKNAAEYVNKKLQ